MIWMVFSMFVGDFCGYILLFAIWDGGFVTSYRRTSDGNLDGGHNETQGHGNERLERQDRFSSFIHSKICSYGRLLIQTQILIPNPPAPHNFVCDKLILFRSHLYILITGWSLRDSSLRISSRSFLHWARILISWAFVSCLICSFFSTFSRWHRSTLGS